MSIDVPTDWHYRERRTGTGKSPPYTCDKAQGPDCRETHANLNQVRVGKEIAADNMGKRTGNMDQQQ
jgi:hypothetical protein